MMSIKNNLKHLFYIILFIGTILFITLSLNLWNDTYEDYRIKNENYTKLISKTAKNYFDQIDLILTILGKQLLENNRYKDRQEAEIILRQKNDTPLKDYIFALVGTDGYVKAGAKEQILKKIPNLLNTKGTRESFLQTLKSKKMVIGRTYKLATSGNYIIPIRKAFRFDNGDPAGVLSVAIELEKLKLFNKELLHDPSHLIHILRDSDRYRQLFIHNINMTNEQIYDVPLPKEVYDKGLQKMQKTTQKSIEKIKENEEILTTTIPSFLNGKEYLISAQFISKYDMIIMYYIPFKEFIDKFLFSFIVYFLIYIIIIWIIWKLFRYISKKEMILVQQSKMATAGEMIGMISHQFKQPLSVISLISGYQKTCIEDGIEITKNQSLEDSNKIIKQVSYLDKTINTFMDFLKPNKPKEKTDVKKVIEDSLVIVEKSLVSYNIKIEKEFTNINKINTIKSELIQVFINLINNSKDAFIINNIKKREIFIKTYDKNNKVIIEIEDNAGGIPENKIDNIFYAYFTTKEECGGTGLGLNIVKTIIEDHNNGSIEVQNTQKGVKFIITLIGI